MSTDTVSVGTSVRLGRRIGAVLAATQDQVRVICAGGVESWDLEQVESTTSSSATLYASRYLEALLEREKKASTEVEVLQRMDAKQKTLITRVAHTQGTANGIGSDLDDLLERHGLARRPAQIVRSLVVKIRVYSPNLSTGGGHDYNSPFYNTGLRLVQPAQVVVYRFLTMEDTIATDTFNPDECDCETWMPDLDRVREHMRNSVSWSHWQFEVLDARTATVRSSQASCRHYVDSGEETSRRTDVARDPCVWFGGERVIAPRLSVGQFARHIGKGVENGWIVEVMGLRDEDALRVRVRSQAPATYLGVAYTFPQDVLERCDPPQQEQPVQPAVEFSVGDRVRVMFDAVEENSGWRGPLRLYKQNFVPGMFATVVSLNRRHPDYAEVRFDDQVSKHVHFSQIEHA